MRNLILSDKELDELNSLADKHGMGTLFRTKQFRTQFPVLRTGIDALDMALGSIDPETGLPGLRQGDLLEVLGENNAFKTGTWEHMAYETVKRFGPKSVVGLFTEPPEVDRYVGLGGDPDDIWTIDTYHEDAEVRDGLAEKSYGTLLDFAKHPRIKLAIIDSVGNVVTKSEMFETGTKEKEVGARTVASKANVTNDFIKRFTLLPVRPALVMVNFHREPISTGFTFTNTFNPLAIQTGGGRGQEFMSHSRVLCSSSSDWKLGPDNKPIKHSIFDEKIEIGRNITYKVFKNKNSKEYGVTIVKTKFDFRTKRINNAEIILDWSLFFTYTNPRTKEMDSILEPKVYRKGTSFWTIGDEKFRGKKPAEEYLNNHPEIREALLRQMAREDYRNQLFSDEKRFKSEFILDEE